MIPKWKKRYDDAWDSLKKICLVTDQAEANRIAEQFYIAGIESEKSRMRSTLGLGVLGEDYGR